MTFEKSFQLYDRATEMIPGGSQTNSKRAEAFAYGGYPIYAKRAKGNRIVDVDGNEYIDLVNAFGPVILGYDYRPVSAAIRRQLREGILSGLMYPEEVQVAELINGMVPCAEMVRYFKGGGEATAAAARICRAATGRDIILTCGYRGWPDVWAAASNRKGVPEELSRFTVTFPYGDLSAVERQLESYRGRVAAVFIDVLDEIPPPGYLIALRDLAHREGALFVFDEIVTGFRLARGGAGEYFGVTPDLACFAKAVANGMPLAVVAGKRAIMSVAADLLISLTYGGEALSLAAAAATLAVIRSEPVNEHLWALGTRLSDGLNRAADSAGVKFRTIGFSPMAFMTFEPIPEVDDSKVWHFFLQEMAARGVLMRRTGANLITYSFTERDIDEIVNKAGEVFGALARVQGSSDLDRLLKTRSVEGRPPAGSMTDRRALGRGART